MDNNNNNNPLNNNNNEPSKRAEYEYKVTPPPAQPTYTNQSNNGFTMQSQSPPSPPQGQQNQQGQQTQWTFNDYGPLGTNPQRPPQTPKPPKPPKNKGTNTGLKVFAVIVSIMFVLSTATFVGYALWDNFDNNTDKGSVSSVDSGQKNDNQGSILDLNPPPKTDTTSLDENGKMTPQAVFKEVGESVVGIVTYVKANGYQVYGQGSGVIMTADGYIVTNAHVVTAEQGIQIAKIDVVLSNGEYRTAKLIGYDEKTDIAVVKIDEPNLKPAVFGDSDSLEVGESVLVIGNPDGVKFANSLAGGVISALNREVETDITGKPVKYIQTDATINPGNSGGALVNLYGQIVGIPVAKVVKTGFEGMGFAIPINDVKPIVESIINSGYVTGRVKIGIRYAFISETHSVLNSIPMGLRVASVDETFDAAKQGVLPGDIITHMDGNAVTNTAELETILDSKKPGDNLELTIYRVNQQTGVAETVKIGITLGEMGPEDYN